MADMANEVSRKSFIYDWLSFLDYDLDRPCLDTEWLLSTLFDASLLSTSKAAGNGGSFFGRSRHLAGNHKNACRWTLAGGSAMICSS
jgi:hypothetical protein